MDVFILTYRGIDYFNNWFKESNYPSTTRFHIVDNGQQTIPKSLKHLVTYATSQNIGCAGGWNLMCKIAFNHLGLDRAIIAQDDGQFTQKILDDVWVNITNDTFVGAYDFYWPTYREVNFGLFGIHKELYEDVGEFDENCVLIYYEDNDYEHRMKLANKKFASAHFDAHMNASLTSTIDICKNGADSNDMYMQSKWGKNYTEFVHPFNNLSMSFRDLMPIRQRVIDVYGNIMEFPSQLEFKKFLGDMNI